MRNAAARLVAASLVAMFLAANASACAGPDAAAGDFTPATDGVLKVATNLPAPGFWEGDVDGFTGGFEYGIARELADRFDLRLEVIDVPFADIARGDLHGADLALSQVTVTQERHDFVMFSRPYYPANMGVLVRDGERIDDLADARDARWVVQGATTEEAFVDDVIRPDDHTRHVGDIEAAVAAVREGSVDAALLDLPSALVAANRSGGALHVTGQFVTTQHMAIAMPSGSNDKEAVDSAIRAMESSRTLDDLVRTELRPALGQDPETVRRIVARVS